MYFMFLFSALSAQPSIHMDTYRCIAVMRGALTLCRRTFRPTRTDWPTRFTHKFTPDKETFKLDDPDTLLFVLKYI